MNSNKSTASIVLGFIGILVWFLLILWWNGSWVLPYFLAWLLPILGFVVTIFGLALGIQGYREDMSKRAKAGIVLNIIFLVVAIVGTTVMVVLRTRNQWFFY